MRTLLAAAALVAAAIAPGALAAQQPSVPATPARPDTLVGRVAADSGAAPDSIDVIVTRGPDRATFRTRTDAQGRWRLVVDPGTGDYLVYVTAPGFVAQRRRITRAATEQRFTIDIVLTRTAVQQLARVEVKASKRKAPDR
ncbi:MAG: carboxypeptidase-like regulatory domain-containing protein, partial [Gemmatimonadaceae bacterium]|nr:carboxypeptidase-like regulatory domain-containing protein [Gemmatimonadaceae bacterium]